METKADRENYLNNIVLERKAIYLHHKNNKSTESIKKLKTNYIPIAYFSVLIVI